MDELVERRAFFELTDEDLARLASLRALAEKHNGDVVDSLYDLILAHSESRAFFLDDAMVARVKHLQRAYFMGLFGGRCDAAYVENRLRIGAAHERIGMAPKWYIGAYSRYLRLVLDRFLAELAPTDALAALASITKLLLFDMSLAIDTYIAANAATVSRQQQAMRSLMTPVVRVHQRVLLLPLIGTVDSQRAEQIVDTLLPRVIEENARAVIIDVVGVPVIDTAVANHLLRTTQAVRLLGAETILTGISAPIARTLVRLGVDISAMYTRALLSDGIEVALGMCGLEITASGPE